MMIDRRLALAGLAAMVASRSVLAQAAPPQRIRGRISALDGAVLAVTARDGALLRIRLADALTVSALRTMELSAISPSSYVGIASQPGPDGELQAVEVLVFPEAMRGAGEGHYAWDLAPNTMMTNATVEAAVASTSGRDLNLVFKGQSVKIRVPTNVPIVTFIPASRSDLVPGAAVFLAATRDAEGNLTAARITVEKDGVAPPM